MINRRATLYLLTFPVALMGGVQLIFGALSVALFRDNVQQAFMAPAVAMLAASYLFWSRYRRSDLTKIGYRDSLLFASLTWMCSGVLGAIPIILVTGVSFTDGVFESISALTTTGATVLSGLDELPKTFLLYRQFLQWLGGLGVVIFVVAVLPMLNVGGMKLLKAETPGPVKDDKLSPRVANTAHYLWIVYIAITVLCALAYFVAGMSFYDAVAHSFTTVSTGGFSTHDASMGYFQSHLILAVSDVFMLLGAISFALHFKVFRARNPFVYLKDEETRTFLLIVAGLSLLLCIMLLKAQKYHDPFTALSDSAFHLVSFITSTGFGAASFTDWPEATAMLLVFAGYLGGCAGSTAGGNKIIRNIISIKSISLEFKRIVHPRGVFVMKYQGRSVGSDVTSATAAFMSFAAGSTLILTLALMATGLEFWSSFTAVAACLNVLGPAFAELGSNFAPVSDTGTWVLSFGMILGRLEYFTLLAIFLPHFWRR
ncbi:potassium transporter [Hahella sp. CR1]|uniref:TrkH family potassium uptake protein n=1 Tax=Hahella sp. CR1 TaxID=2992807 RepID=UPI0024426406|nr:potassium transporter TrkG [Hahella sp. CR1]MDG9671868.1 potassium transporter [Hahella sp. CR1]